MSGQCRCCCHEPVDREHCAAQGGGLKAVEGHAWSGAGHVGPAESDGQLQVLLLLEPQPPQPLLLLTLALPLGPFQLLVLTSEHREVQAG